MSREIKFRAWHEGYPGTAPPVMLFDEKPGDCLYFLKQGQPVQVMQYTGLKDKNGKEIYEGDIVRSWNLLNDDKSPAICKVVWHMNFYAIERLDKGTCTGLPFGDGQFGVEVIGNIYENPELLKP